MRGNVVHTYDHIIVTAVGNYSTGVTGTVFGPPAYTYYYYFKDGLPCFDHNIIRKTHTNEFITWDEITHAREMSSRYLAKLSKPKHWWEFWK